MELNTQPIKSQEKLKKDKLYQVSPVQPVVTWMEEHEDSEPEIVDIDFLIPKDGNAVYAYEYRNKDYRKSKAADILCIIFDHLDKRVLTWVFDCKRSMTGYDEAKPVDELRRIVVGRIKEFLIQIQDSILHKEGLTAEYVKYCGYKEELRAGIISRNFDQDKLARLEDRMQGAICSSGTNLGIIGKKYDIATAGIRKDIEIVRDFRNKKITVLNMDMDLQVYLLEHSDEKKGYYVKIKVAG